MVQPCATNVEHYLSFKCNHITFIPRTLYSTGFSKFYCKGLESKLVKIVLYDLNLLWLVPINREELFNQAESACPCEEILQMCSIVRGRGGIHVSIQQTRVVSCPKCYRILQRLRARKGMPSTLAILDRRKSQS